MIFKGGRGGGLEHKKFKCKENVFDVKIFPECLQFISDWSDVEGF